MNSFDIEWKSLTRVLEEYADYFIQEAKDNLGKYGAYASGKLADTMKPFIEIGQEGFKIKINLQDYWYYVENGAKGIESSPAGAKCKAHRPPVPKIKEWIEVKGIGTGDSDKDLGMAIAISKNIEKRGIPPKPFFREAKETTYEAFENRIVYAIQEDIDAYVENVLLEYAKMLGL